MIPIAPFARSNRARRVLPRSRVLAFIIAVLLGACSSVPARFNDPKSSSVALAHPEETRLGAQFGSAARQRDGESVSRYGNYGLHAKLLVFDRKRIFIGSMNFDQRSKHLNTEIGLIIDSPELAQQSVARFDHMVQPDNVYVLARRATTAGASAHLVWTTRENGNVVEYTQEPARSSLQRFDMRFLSWLPLDREL